MPSRRAGRRTKIVATLGPSSWREPVLSRLLAAGVDVVRLNFSHSTQADHEQTIAQVRAAESRLGWPVCILQDLGGPKIRIGRIDGGAIALRRGQQLVIDPGCDMGGPGRVGISFAGLATVVRRGTRLLRDDGRIEMRVTAVDGDTVACRVLRGEELRERKGVNLPGVQLPLPSVTDKGPRRPRLRRRPRGRRGRPVVRAQPRGHARPGDTLVFVFGQPVNQPGGTNTVTIHRAAASRRRTSSLAAPG
jgi:pyruvate kinase